MTQNNKKIRAQLFLRLHRKTNREGGKNNNSNNNRDTLKTGKTSVEQGARSRPRAILVQLAVLGFLLPPESIALDAPFCTDRHSYTGKLTLGKLGWKRRSHSAASYLNLCK